MSCFIDKIWQKIAQLQGRIDEALEGGEGTRTMAEIQAEAHARLAKKK